MEKIEAALKLLARYTASNRVYIASMRGEGHYLGLIDAEIDEVLERLDKTLHPENWE